MSVVCSLGLPFEDKARDIGLGEQYKKLVLIQFCGFRADQMYSKLPIYIYRTGPVPEYIPVWLFCACLIYCKLQDPKFVESLESVDASYLDNLKDIVHTILFLKKKCVPNRYITAIQNGISSGFIKPVFRISQNKKNES